MVHVTTGGFAARDGSPASALFAKPKQASAIPARPTLNLFRACRRVTDWANPLASSSILLVMKFAFRFCFAALRLCFTGLRDLKLYRTRFSRSLRRPAGIAVIRHKVHELHRFPHLVMDRYRIAFCRGHPLERSWVPQGVCARLEDDCISHDSHRYSNDRVFGGVEKEPAPA